MVGSEVEPGVSRGAFGAVTVGAIDFEPGSGSAVEGSSSRVVPDRHPWGLTWGRGCGESPCSSPVGELVLGPVPINKVAVELARPWADRFHSFARLVASFTLIDVGNDIVVGSAIAVGMNPGDINDVTRHFERGVGLGFVPALGEADPTVGFVGQNACLDQTPTL